MSISGYPDAVNELIELLKGLPGVGRRSAERMALAMLDWNPDKLDALGSVLKELPGRVGFCPECGHLSEKDHLCGICASASRDHSTICVVEDPSQVINIEKSALFRGVYHVLGGKLAPLEGKTPENLNIEKLKERVAGGKVREMVLAFSSDVEGRATAIYLAGLFSGSNVKITRLASGLPAGSNISFADPETIAAAFSGRTNI
jgi:recombination protein RecR